MQECWSRYAVVQVLPVSDGKLQAVTTLNQTCSFEVIRLAIVLQQLSVGRTITVL